MKILSVDFDHFLPDWSSFDWGQSELDPRLFGEHVWAMRACNRGPDGPAHETIVPRGHIGFWDRVLDDIPPVKLVVVDSHSVMNDILADLKRNRATPVEVVNVDAHHDMGYGVKDDSPNPPDCANWAWYGLTRKQISKYTVVYPRWRQSCPEGFARSRPHRARASSTTLLPEKQYYGMVVVCRSSAWTPTWCDQEWMKFIGWWEQKHPSLWRNKGYNEYALKPRGFDLKAAKAMQRQLDDLLSGKSAERLSRMATACKEVDGVKL